MKKEILKLSGVPEPIGPYSTAVRFGDFVYISGQLGVDPITGDLASGGIEEETKQVIMNLIRILSSIGVSLDDVIKTTVFLKNMDDFPIMNQIYSDAFRTNPPARSTIEVSRLPKDAHIEIEVIASSHNKS